MSDLWVGGMMRSEKHLSPVQRFFNASYEVKQSFNNMIAIAPDEDTAEKLQEVLARAVSEINDIEVSVFGESDVSLFSNTDVEVSDDGDIL